MTPLKPRPLGATGLAVSRLGLGLAALGRPAYINLGHAEDLEGEYHPEVMETRAFAVLDAAWDEGIRYFDVARSYGRAEQYLGRWLQHRSIDAEHVTVGSKWGYEYTADWRVDADDHEVKDHSYRALRSQWPESRRLLGGHLDLYQVHSATVESGVLEDGSVLRELARLRTEARVEIGLTLSGPHQADTLRRAMDVRIQGRKLFTCVQATWNLLERSAGPALAEAHEAGLGVIVKEALANGRLTFRNADPAFDRALAALQSEAVRLETTVDALVLAAALARPWADVVLSGAATPDHVRSNADGLGVAWDDEAEARLAGLAEPAAEYWERRGRLRWN